MPQLKGVYAVTVPPDISEEPVRWLFVNEADADRYVEEVEPEGVVSFEPIAHEWDDSDLQGYIRDIRGDEPHDVHIYGAGAK